MHQSLSFRLFAAEKKQHHFREESIGTRCDVLSLMSLSGVGDAVCRKQLPDVK